MAGRGEAEDGGVSDTWVRSTVAEVEEPTSLYSLFRLDSGVIKADFLTGFQENLCLNRLDKHARAMCPEIKQTLHLIWY